MENFAAVDFEIANNEHTSVCSVGVVIVREGKIVDSFYSLIQPDPNYYCYWNTKVHGLTREDTDDAPVFPEVWSQIAPMIEGLPLLAHNKSFDESCLKAVGWTTIIMPWQMQKLVPGLRGRFCENIIYILFEKVYNNYGNYIWNIKS